MGIQDRAVHGVRRLARHSPTLYNWRNQHNVVVQRLRGGVHDSDFDVLRHLDTDRPLVIDVGANTGQTLQTVKTLLPRARVVCVEPSALVLTPLVKLAQRFDEVEVAPFAAGSAYGTARISTPVARGIYFTQYATLTDPDPAMTAGLLNHAGFGPLARADVSFHAARCVVAPLDEVVDECDVLKVDAEGFEDEVFAGAARLVESSLPVIIAERPSPALSTRLQAELGYVALPTGSRVNVVLAHPDRPRGVGA